MARSTKTKKSKEVNYRSVNRRGTAQKQRVLLELLSRSDVGHTVTELAKLVGMSRQLCLYHVKKMAAQAQLVMILEPCLGNGGLQFRVWDESQLGNAWLERWTAPSTPIPLTQQRAA